MVGLFGLQKELCLKGKSLSNHVNFVEIEEN